MSKRFLGACAALVALAATAACTTTTYRSYEGNAAEALPWDREIVYDVDPAIYASPPACVLVAPAAPDTPLSKTIERALARHLGEKVSRAIGPAERRRAERELALDLSDARDRLHFASASGCAAILEWTVLAATDEYALVFSQRRFGLEVALTLPGGGATLWQAAHVAQRSDGGIPLSLVSVPLAAFEASRFHQDEDIVASMVEDVVRRLFVTLPDLG